MKANEIYIRDPFIFVEDGVAYLVGTTDVNAWGGPADGFLGYRTEDLENFEGPFTLFEANPDFWANENFWAPELHKIGGKYYLSASFKKAGKCRASQLLVSDSPMGKYTPLEKPFTPEDWECLDATMYEENGKLYTVFCHEWTQVGDGEMRLGQLNAQMTDLVGEPVLLFKASDAPWVRAHNGKDFITDGPYLYPLKSGKLLMLWSSVGEKGYAMGMAISENGVKGPWKHLEKPLFDEDGGHGMVFSFKGKTYVSLHCPNGPHLAERPRFYEVEEDGGDRLKIK